ncbi:MAG: hypothetical protein ACTSYL_05260 [Candidatus Thorarchaeota archaeon]
MSNFEITPEVKQILDVQPKWVKVFGKDPRESLLMCDESYTIYRTLTDLLGLPETHSVVKRIRSLVLSDDQVTGLISNLPTDWKTYLVKGHDKADYPPSVLLLLFDFGVRAEDSPKIKNLLEQMRTLQDDDGRFLSLARFPKKGPIVGSSPCDTHIITEVLIRGLPTVTENLDIFRH